MEEFEIDLFEALKDLLEYVNTTEGDHLEDFVFHGGKPKDSVVASSVALGTALETLRPKLEGKKVNLIFDEKLNTIKEQR